MPQAGYYRYDLMSPKMTKCPNSKACIAGTITELTGSCDNSYSGALCAQCTKGNSQILGSFECTACPDKPVAILIYVFTWLACIGFILWMFQVFLNNFFKKDNKTLTLIKLLLTHL